MQDLSEGQATAEVPRKRAAVGDGISAGSASPYRDSSASPPPPRRSKARPVSGQYARSEKEIFDARPKPLSKQLWTEDTTPLSKSSVDPSNVASIKTQRSRAQALQPPPRNSFPATPQAYRNLQSGPTILSRNASSQSLPTRDDDYDIIMQPETRPISQEQLVAEVKGIYAGLGKFCFAFQ
jgi:hypothetical protein